MGTVHNICPRCGEDLPEGRGENCPGCGIETALYKKALDMSHVYYNRGLKATDAGALTNAIEALEASLNINKRNISARNLLGLCYYAMGRIGEALREWVISDNYRDVDNPAKNYLEAFKAEPLLLEKYSEALKSYNEALRYMLQRSDDLAAIRLKRAIELVPNFVEAINLLALFHLKNGDKMKAGTLAERALAIDNANPVANRFYGEVFRKKAVVAKKSGDATPEKEESRQAAPERPSRQTAQNAPFGVQNQNVFAKRKDSPVKNLIAFVLGLGIMFAFMHLLIMPSILEDAWDESAGLAAQMAANEVSHGLQVAELEENIAVLEQDLTRAAAAAAGRDARLADMENETLVTTSHAYFVEGMHAQALEILERVNASRLSPDALFIYNLVKDASMPIMEQHYFTLGQNFFNGSNYDEARWHLLRAHHHITEGSANAPWIFYLLGRIAEEFGEFEAARQYYETIIRDFPGSNRVNPATQRLNAITQ